MPKRTRRRPQRSAGALLAYTTGEAADQAIKGSDHFESALLRDKLCKSAMICG